MLKSKIKNLPIVGKILINIKNSIFPTKGFKTSRKYWEDRYRYGGNSGAGSYNNLAKFKAKIINSFVAKNNIDLVIEFGCGDGNQLKYFSFKNYIGYDVSKTAITLCAKTFRGDKSKQFKSLDAYKPIKADLSLSLDVIYHLVEDKVFYDYMSKLFDSSDGFVIIYASNTDAYDMNKTAEHVRHRKFTNWIEQHRPNFKLIEHIPNKFKFDGNGDDKNSSFADFYIFKKD